MEWPRTAYITNVKVPAGDAQSRQILSMARAFHHVLPGRFALVTPRFPDQPEQRELPWIRLRVPLHSRMLRYLTLGARIPFQIWRRGFRLVFTRDIGVALVAGMAGARVIYEIHKAPKPAAARTLRFLRRFPHFKLLAISEALRAFVVDRLEFPRERTEVLHDAVDRAPFDALRGVSKEALRDGLGLPRDKILVMHTGNAAPDRGFAQIASLLEASPDVLFLQIGGRPEDIAHWKTLFAGSERIRFLPAQSQATVFRYQMAADLVVYLMTRQCEIWWCSSPLKIFEYLASGTPILASRIGSIGEVLDDTNSIGFDPDVPGDLRRQFEFFLAHREEAHRRAVHGTQQRHARLSWEDRCRSILEFDRGPLPMAALHEAEVYM